MTLRGHERYQYYMDKKAEGKSSQEIAKNLGIQYDSLRSWLSRYRKRVFGNVDNNVEQGSTDDQQLSKSVHTTSMNIHTSDMNTLERPPDLIDTRPWTWYDWFLVCLGLRLSENQILELEAMDAHMHTLRLIYRRSGKTTVINFGYILRHLAESIFHEFDQLIYYYSAVEKNIVIMGQGLIDALENNEFILQNYGRLVKDYISERKGSKRKAKNTITEITLHSLKLPFQANYTAILLGKKFKGAQNAYRVIIDDPMDSKEITDKHYSLLTDKLEFTLLDRLLPLAKNAKHISMSGTPYAFDDIYQRFKNKAGWKFLSRPVARKYNFSNGWSYPKDIPRELLKPSDIIVNNEDEWEITDPIIWKNLVRDRKATAIQNVIWMYDQMKNSKTGVRGFFKEFLMSVIALSSIVKFEDFQKIPKLPAHPSFYRWCIFCDDGSGSSQESDDRALCLVAYDPKRHRFYLLDMLFFKHVGTRKIQTILNFHALAEDRYGVPIPLKIETVVNQTTFTLLKERGAPVQKATPRGRGDKEYRIMDNLLIFLQESCVYMLEDIRQQDELQMECLGFGKVHVNMLDSIDQAVHTLRKKLISKETKEKAFELFK